VADRKRNDVGGAIVAVTGGAGLIGSFVVDELVAKGAKVVVVDDFSKGLWSNLAHCMDRIEIREGDLEDRDFAREALADAEFVFHLASRAYGIGYSENHHLEALLHNERISNNLLEQMAARPPRHLLIASSSCVYPDDGPDTVAESREFAGEPERANLGYGWAKRLLEQKFSLLSNQVGLPVTIVRPFNIYGERYRWVGAYSQAIPMLVKRILDGEDPVVVWGSGRQRRTYLHACDCARVMCRLVELGQHGDPVNIGLQETVSIRELVEMICKVAGRTPLISFDTRKPEGRFVKSADVSRLSRELGTYPIQTIELEDGLRRMADWYGANFGRASGDA
jgi:nucleoside-diphosphate-sugar epimerase